MCGFYLLIVTLRWHGILFLVDSRGFALKNNTDLTTKERDYMKEKYCKAKYCTMCVTFYKLPSNSFIFDRMSSNVFSLNKIFLRHTLLFISFS